MTREQTLIPGVETAYEPWLEDPDVALTPRAVARQGIDFALSISKRVVRTMLDPCAGSGVFGAEAAGMGFDRLGIEPAAHAWDWERHYGRALTTTLQEYVEWSAGHSQKREAGTIDLVVGNPPFSHLIEFVELGHDLLSQGGVLCYLGLNDWGQRGEDHEALWRRLRPSHMARIPGAIQFKTGTNPKTGKPWTADMRSYCWWAWRKGDRPRHTRMTTLPRLSLDERRWTEPPGQESEAA